MSNLISKREAAELLGISHWTLSEWRRKGRLKRGVHYVCYNPRVCRYSREALQHWLDNQDTPEAHQEYCAAVLNNKRTAG